MKKYQLTNNVATFASTGKPVRVPPWACPASSTAAALIADAVGEPEAKLLAGKYQTTVLNRLPPETELGEWEVESWTQHFVGLPGMTSSLPWVPLKT